MVLRGAIFDVAVDLRSDSATYGRWTANELDGNARRMLYVPAGFAHGFQTLEDETELLYLMGHPYRRDSAGGIRWDDPSLRIPWPLSDVTMSERDRALPLMPEPLP